MVTNSPVLEEEADSVAFRLAKRSADVRRCMLRALGEMGIGAISWDGILTVCFKHVGCGFRPVWLGKNLPGRSQWAGRVVDLKGGMTNTSWWTVDDDRTESVEELGLALTTVQMV